MDFLKRFVKINFSCVTSEIRLWVGFLVLFFLHIVSLVMMEGNHQQISIERHQFESQIRTELYPIQVGIVKLEQSPTSHQNQKLLLALLKDIENIQSTTDEIKTQTEPMKIINDLKIDEMKTRQENKTLSLQKQKNKVKPLHRSTKLPFKLIGIDVWNGDALATVLDNGKCLLMGIGDVQNAWRLIGLSFDTRCAVFKNSLGQIRTLKV